MVFNKIYHKPESGILDIVVPENMLKEFTEKGGKYYKQYQDLLRFASDQKVKIDVKISSDVD